MDFQQYNNNIRNINNRVLELVFSNINNCQEAVQQDVLPFVAIDSFHSSLSILIKIEYESRTVEFPSATNDRLNLHKANFNQLIVTSPILMGQNLSNIGAKVNETV